MARQLDTKTLDLYARQYVGWWLLGHQAGRPDRDRAWLIKEFYNFTYKDEFDYLVSAVSKLLTESDKIDFDTRISELKTKHPRDESTFRKLLAEKLGIDPDGRKVK